MSQRYDPELVEVAKSFEKRLATVGKRPRWLMLDRDDPRFLKPHMPWQRMHMFLLLNTVINSDPEGFMQQMEVIFEAAGDQARLDELQRIKASTLDADTDVWSKTDDGKLVSLTERIQQLSS
jgi:hypothetical protein